MSVKAEDWFVANIMVGGGSDTGYDSEDSFAQFNNKSPLSRRNQFLYHFLSSY
ncbi:hypothetical protein Scep_025081 [Stephania cephalantha]|uniref:Uncharacterized protein n=1 Tax=Stephania cephalantha TaxID=152367 RepID=A0AAP0EZ04_9MAGN